MAKEVVAQRGVTIRLACQVFTVSQSCFRYQAKTDVENKKIADWLLRLTDNNRNWGFGLYFFLYLRNIKGLLCPGTAMSYQLVTQWKEEAITVQQACHVLGVSCLGYYASWQRARLPATVCADTVQLKAAFAASGKAYDGRRQRTAMQSRGVLIGRYRVRSLMLQHELRTLWRRKFVHTTGSKHSLPVSPNVLDRQFNPSGHN